MSYRKGGRIVGMVLCCSRPQIHRGSFQNSSVKYFDMLDKLQMLLMYACYDYNDGVSFLNNNICKTIYVFEMATVLCVLIYSISAHFNKPLWLLLFILGREAWHACKPYQSTSFGITCLYER